MLSLKNDLKAAREAVAKLDAYAEGQKACKSNEPTPMYYRLNAKADAAIKKLPFALRSSIALNR